MKYWSVLVWPQLTLLFTAAATYCIKFNVYQVEGRRYLITSCNMQQPRMRIRSDLCPRYTDRKTYKIHVALVITAYERNTCKKSVIGNGNSSIVVSWAANWTLFLHVLKPCGIPKVWLRFSCIWGVSGLSGLFYGLALFLALASTRNSNLILSPICASKLNLNFQPQLTTSTPYSYTHKLSSELIGHFLCMFIDCSINSVAVKSIDQ